VIRDMFFTLGGWLMFARIAVMRALNADGKEG